MRAIVTVFDEETGRVYAKDKLIHPAKEDQDFDDLSTGYVFAFHLRVLNSDKQIIEPNEELLKAIGMEDNNGIHET